MEIDDARNAALQLRWCADYLRDHALLAANGVGDNSRLMLAERNFKLAAHTMGFKVERLPVLPAAAEAPTSPEVERVGSDDREREDFKFGNFTDRRR